MTECELLKITLKRHNWTVRAAAAALGLPLGTLNGYLGGHRATPPTVWIAILEYEARLYERHQDIAERAAALNASKGNTPPKSAPESTGGRSMRRKPKSSEN